MFIWRRELPKKQSRGDQVSLAAGMKLTNQTKFPEATVGELLLRHFLGEAHVNVNELAENRVETQGQSPSWGLVPALCLEPRGVASCLWASVSSLVNTGFSDNPEGSV